MGRWEAGLDLGALRPTSVMSRRGASHSAIALGSKLFVGRMKEVQDGSDKLRNDYVLEQFSRAVEALATLPGDARSRLEYVYRHHLAHVHPGQLPRALEAQFQKVRDRMTGFEPQLIGEGRIRASSRRMREPTPSRLAEIVVNIWNELNERHRS